MTDNHQTQNTNRPVSANRGASFDNNVNTNNNNSNPSVGNSSSWLGLWKPSSPSSSVNINNNTDTQVVSHTIITSSDGNEETIDKKNVIQGGSNAQQGQDNNNSDSNDNQNKTTNDVLNENTSGHSNGSSSQLGLWYWLGYPTATITNSKSTTPNVEQSLNDDTSNNKDASNNNHRRISANLSVNDHSAKSTPPLLSSSTSTPSTTTITTPISTSASSSITSNNKSIDSVPIPNRSSWRSYFFSDNSTKSDKDATDDTTPSTMETTSNSTPPSLSTEILQQDSVIIESSNNNQNDQRKRMPSSSTSTKNEIKTLATTRNVVLPSITSQFSAPPLSQTIFSKAINAINSIFTQSSDIGNQNQHLVASIIKQMKAKPDTVAGKKFVIIGVHGWFPAKLVRSVMGEPTGTSAKFCEQTAKSLQQYFEQEHDLVLPMNCMTLIPLQWEGKVQERVEKLYSFLVDNPATLDALQSADAIFWTTHSQGTPVSAILLHRLIQNKIIQLKKQPICLLAMAGIAHGPFASLKGSLIVKYFEADAARELFEFMDPSSEISEVFRQAMAYILQQGVKTILVGSMQDQVVPLYSAIMVATEHPNILRAIYIDGHVYSPDDFLINLIVFALRLRNAGLSDHGLLLHISDVLAGNLYAWEGGHSTIYEETSVYKLAPHYLFDTSPLGGLLPNHQENHTTTRTSTMVEAKSELFHTKVRLNPYYLTWAMRGIFDDVRVIQVFGDQLDRLRILFDQWHPTSSKLREIKFRLEPIKARL